MNSIPLRSIGLLAIFTLSLLFTLSCGNGKSATANEDGGTVTDQRKFDIASFTPGKSFEFQKSSLIKECTDPDIKRVTVIDDKTVKLYAWHKGCPNNQINEEELIYTYRIDDASNWSQEYRWLKTDSKVILLENEKAGYYNGYELLSKRYMITNAYNESKFIEPRIFEQLDEQEYPSRNGVFTSDGTLR
ncbi:MAG: hypothetical protein FJZ66_06720 [Bacteroidetes bacterium]|nr:hypothetical protein [Bacteroidota bacterium]